MGVSAGAKRLAKWLSTGGLTGIDKEHGGLMDDESLFDLQLSRSQYTFAVLRVFSRRALA
jgi:hypothetical protein